MTQNTDPRVVSYFQQGSVWELDLVKKERRSKNVAWFIALISSAALIVALLALAGLTPLKTFEPYLVLVDKNTGYIEIKTARNTDYNALGLTERQAVTQANVVRFIRMREGYDPLMISENFGTAALLSTGDAARELQELYSATNAKNPTKIYGKNKRVSVDVKSVTFLNDSTAQARFSVTERSDTEQVTRHYVSVLRYRYTSAPSTNAWMFENPLGFQIYSYRRDQETVAPGANG
ncbi:VirB8/TrbF family protein (plasmid) [Agrobacterium sp. 13-2099-1-2]|uniref:virB8 family protein n=1 Tax=Agrobacterium sp. 13-2099-1-2 TaxID=1841651 RepID=UPI00080FC0E6|nr:type IV secretion system protein [Agrobacterium sp. 13-2099-1-2]UZX45525.1 VirB8/TrbF family protein [Agrobacterium sp. 13-2099-1-2]